MYKIVKFFSFIVYPLAISLVFLGMPIPTEKADADESITLTTYYPAPYGVYDGLAVNRLGVGDQSGNGLGQDDVPPGAGDVWVANDLTTKRNLSAGGVGLIVGRLDVGGVGSFGGNVLALNGYVEASGPGGTDVSVLEAGEVEGVDFGPTLYSKLDGTYVRQDNNTWVQVENNLSQLLGLILIVGLICTAFPGVCSSIRFKKNVKTLDKPLEKVMKLRGVDFDWKSSGKHDIGMIAEEVAEVIPEMVIYENDGKTIQGLYYQKLVGLLVEAIKEQQQQILNLKEEQQQQISTLKERMDALTVK